MTTARAPIHPYSETWVPYRDPRTGEVVTITWPQAMAVLHAWRIVNEVRTASQVRAPVEDDEPERSRALGRLLIEGKPLFLDRPPIALGAADYSLWDQENEDALGDVGHTRGDDPGA